MIRPCGPPNTDPVISESIILIETLVLSGVGTALALLVNEIRSPR